MNKKNLVKLRKWWRDNKVLVVIGSFAVIVGSLEIWAYLKWFNDIEKQQNKTEVLKTSELKNNTIKNFKLEQRAR